MEIYLSNRSPLLYSEQVKRKWLKYSRGLGFDEGEIRKEGLEGGLPFIILFYVILYYRKSRA